MSAANPGYDANRQSYQQPPHQPPIQPYVDPNHQSFAAEPGYQSYADPSRLSYVDAHRRSQQNVAGTADGPEPPMENYRSGVSDSPPQYPQTPEPQAPKNPAVLNFNDISGAGTPPLEANEEGKAFLDEKGKGFPRLPASFRKDQTKAVCTTNRFSALGTFVMYHLPALAATGVLLALYIINQNWKSANISSEKLSALQFAAKVHEALLLMSLTDVLLHRVRYGLLGDQGIPLGFLSAAFHLYAPILYLFSWEFWSTAFHKTRNPKFHRTTSAIIILFIIVGIAVGPFSAVAMIPRLQWLETDDQLSMFNSTTFQGPQQPYILTNPYLMSLDESSVPVARGRNIRSFRESPNVTTLVTQAITTMNTVPLDGSFAQFNLTVAADGTMTPFRPLTMGFHLDGEITLSYATAPMGFLSDTLSTTMAGGGRFLTGPHEYMIQSKPSASAGFSKWKNPLVTTRCAQALHDPSVPDRIGFSFGDDLFKSNITMDFTGPLSVLQGYKESSAFNVPNAFILDTSTIEKTVNIPLSAAVLLTNHIAEEFQADAGTDLFIELCLVQARWVEAESWVDTSHPVAVQSELTIPDDRILSYLESTNSKDDLVQLKEDWITNIGPSRNNTDGTRTYNADLTDILQHSMNMYMASWNAPGALILSELLSAYVTDAMSFIALPMDFKPSSGVEDKMNPPPKDAILVERTIYWYLYVYTFKDSTAIPVAFAILLLHAIIVAVHFSLILFSLKPWHSHGWEDFGEFIALALRSRASNLHNVGGGATSSETWRKSITVREVEGDGHLEMVVDDPRISTARGLLQGQPGGLKKVVPGQKYS